MSSAIVSYLNRESGSRVHGVLRILASALVDACVPRPHFGYSEAASAHPSEAAILEAHMVDGGAVLEPRDLRQRVAVRRAVQCRRRARFQNCVRRREDELWGTRRLGRGCGGNMKSVKSKRENLSSYRRRIVRQ